MPKFSSEYYFNSVISLSEFLSLTFDRRLSAACFFCDSAVLNNFNTFVTFPLPRFLTSVSSASSFISDESSFECDSL